MPQFVDFFVVCGVDGKGLAKDNASALSSHIPPLLRSYSPSLICHYPRTRDGASFDEGAILTLCLPAGVQFQKNLKDSQKSFHSFLITRENGSHSYGSVVTFFEQVTDSSIMNTLEALQSSYRESRRTVFNSDHEDYLDQNEDKLFATKCLCLVTSQPIHRPCQAYLEQLFAVAVGELSASLPVESYLFNLLYEVSLPGPGKYLKLAGPLGKISWHMPLKSNFPLCDYSFREFFEMLGVHDVLNVLTCVLLEHQVLLKASDYHKLMTAANCLTALLFPFTWPHVFVPILPASQRGFLDAPVPYIMGLRVQPSGGGTKYLNIANESSLCSVDLDQHSVDTPDDLPELPNRERLIRQISEKVQEYFVNCPGIRDLPSSPKTTPSKGALVEAIRIMKELTKAQGTDQKVLISQISEEQKSNPLLPNLLNMARRAGLTVLEEDTVADQVDGAEEAEEDESDKNEWDYSPDKKDLQFSSAVRDIFASHFVEHFANYENFIIMPQQTYDQWQRNREQFQNFDKTAFLSDQPTQYWPFYSAFLESNMFSAFIDEKMTSIWEPPKASQQLLLFDSRVEAYRDKSGIAKPPTTPGSQNITEVSSLFPDVSPDSSDVINDSAPLPHPLSGEKQSVIVAMRSKTRQPGAFPELDIALLQPKSSSTKGEDDSDIVNASLPFSSTPRTLPRPSSASRSLHMMKASGSPAMSIWSRRLRGGVAGGSMVGGVTGSISGGFSSYSHAKFVNQLWRESRLRVKHMLGSSAESQSSVEENTHIAYLCDLLERIWGHGLKKRDSKSPLWAHLTAYAETADSSERSAAAPPAHPPSPPQLSSSMSSLVMTSTSPGAGVADDSSSRSAQSIRAQFRRRKFGSPQLRSQIEGILQPPPSSFLSDFLLVHNMRELKTDAGRARAWVRLTLEKKSLSRHLSTLLSRDELTSKRYREYAFLRTDDEKEQFLYHLLTLTAKDFSSFTTGFVSTTMVYRVLVVAEGKHFGLSTSELYLTVAGEYGDSGLVRIPRGEYQVDITHYNLGPLTCLRIGHDNSGITPSLLVEMVLVHNTTTGQIYRFKCGRWLSRSEEDGSIERFLIAEKVPQTVKNSCNMAALGVDSVLPSPGSRRRVARREPESSGVTSLLKSSLKTVVERIRLAVQGKRRELPVQELLELVHGENGYIRTMERILLHGFKSSRKFSKRLFLWDMVEKVGDQISADEVPPPLTSSQPEPGSYQKQLFCNTVSRINSNYTQIGKDEKMALFLCVGLRDHHTPSWIQLMAQCLVVTAPLYEPLSFLRHPQLLDFLLSTLSSTSSLCIRIEPLLTQGM